MLFRSGDTWKQYYETLKEMLLKSVKQKGDIYWWDPTIDLGRGGVGSVYCTAVYTMILAMPCHYIPLYQR